MACVGKATDSRLRRMPGWTVTSVLAPQLSEQYYTLLGVRPDGVASIVDLIASEQLGPVRARAKVLLREHQSCTTVEVWRDGALLETLSRRSA